MEFLWLPKPRARQSTLRLPGDKSVSHRAFMLSAIAAGETRVLGANTGEDVLATIAALRRLGVRIVREGDEFLVRGSHGFRSPGGIIDCGNSGTTMRLLAGLLAGRVAATLDGDASLRRRPMDRVAQPLNSMGADVRTAPRGRPPLRIRAPGPLNGGHLRVDVPSAQVKSAVMLAALHALGTTHIRTQYNTRDHTERMLRDFGARIAMRGKVVTIHPGQLRSPGRLEVFGDLSLAVYFLCAAALLPGARLRLRKVGVNPTRTAILDLLREMGVQLRIEPLRGRGSEPAANLEIRGGAPLRCTRVSPRIVPEIIDEIPALCALSACAGGVLRIRGAGELRHKESDRVATTVALLERFGADVQATEDGIVVRGGRQLRAPASVATHGDHRIGMAAAILAVGAGAPLLIRNTACIATSFPGFEKHWRAAF